MKKIIKKIAIKIRNWIEEWLGVIAFVLSALIGTYLGFWKILCEPLLALAETSIIRSFGTSLQFIARLIIACVVYYVFYLFGLLAEDRIDDVMIDHIVDREWEEKCNAEEDSKNENS